MSLCVLEAGHGMESNGTEISVWNMEDTRVEWNGRFQEWNGRQSFILLYQFHFRFCALYLHKNTYRCRVVISSVARGGGGAIAPPPPIGMSTKMQNGKKHYVFSTFETVLCSGVD